MPLNPFRTLWQSVSSLFGSSAYWGTYKHFELEGLKIRKGLVDNHFEEITLPSDEQAPLPMEMNISDSTPHSRTR